ncbi:MAG: hypothetical protein ACRDVM_10485 [Acidimicrobiia bacterium]
MEDKQVLREQVWAAVREAAMPALISTAGVVDSTMRALSLVGVDYQAEVPLDDALVEVRDRLGEIPDRLRAQAEPLARAGADLVGLADSAEAVSDELTDLHVRLLDAGLLLERYSLAADRAEDVLETVRSQVLAQARLAKLLVAGLGVVLALGQTVPLAAGWWLLRGGAE